MSEPQPTLSRRGAILASLGLAAFGIVLALIVVWAVFQAFPHLRPGATRFVFATLDGDTFRHQPGLVRPPAENQVVEDVVRFDDSDGFRQPAWVAAEYPIAALGDSFTDGGEIPWTDVLAESLNVPVRNMGWSGFGPLEYAEIARRYLRPETEWVLVMFFEGNDLSNIATSTQSKFQNNGVLPLDLHRNIAPPVLDLKTAEEYGYINEQDWYLYPLMHPALNNHAIAYISDYLWWLVGDIEVYRESRNVRRLGVELEGIAEAAGDACVAVVYAPTKEHIYVPYADPMGNRIYVLENAREPLISESGWIGFTPLQKMDWDTVASRLDNMRTVVRETVEGLDMAFIDLTPAFQEAAARGEIAYFEYDSHWNVRGHELAGQTVADAMRALGECPR